MKKLGLILLVFLSLIFINKTKASHLMGSDLTWTCVGQDSFLIKLVVYRDCNGITLGSSPILFKCATSGASVASLNIGVGIPVDITPVCNNSCTRCQSLSCSFPYGIHKYTMQGIVMLNNAGSCCSIAISWAQSSRNSTITTIPNAGIYDLYIEALLNRCLSPCDNSPSFTNPPIAILCVGQDFTFNSGVQDIDINSTGGLADSLTYEWTPPLAAQSMILTYNGLYTYDKAINFYGFPNDTLPLPQGLHLDPRSGDFQFRPMQAEVTVMVLKVNEFRNGVKIAEVRRDLQIIVITCSTNNPPSVTTPNNIRSKSVCAGSPVSFTFSTNDVNANDTVSISWNNSIPGAVWIHTNGQSKHPTGTLTWTPTVADAGTLPYTFTVTATDDACPIRGSSTLSYQITVLNNPEVTAATQSGDTMFCRNEGWIPLNGQPSGTGGIWSGPGINGNNFNTAIGADATTDYTLRYEFTDSNKCKNSANLKVTVVPEPGVAIDPSANKQCFGQPYYTRAGYAHATGVLWWKGAQSDGTIIGPADSPGISYNPGTGDISRLYFWLYVRTTDVPDHVCSPAYDSIKAFMGAQPVIDFAGNPVVGNPPLTVQFTDMSTINKSTITTWEWTFGDGDMSGDQNPIHTYQNPGKYSVKLKVISDAGCVNTLIKADYINTTNGIEPLNSSVKLKLYPNPAHNMLFAEYSGKEHANLILTDILGNTILENKIIPSINEINLQNYKPGIYFIFLDGMIAGKILIE